MSKHSADSRRRTVDALRAKELPLPPPPPSSLLFIPTAGYRQVERKDAVFSIGRIAWLVLALQSGNVNNLRAGCEDKMHQPQRARQDAYKHVRRVPPMAGVCNTSTLQHLLAKIRYTVRSVEFARG